MGILGWGLSGASLTHGLEHQVNVPVILCLDHVQEADDVGMVPKLLGREQGASLPQRWLRGTLPEDSAPGGEASG